MLDQVIKDELMKSLYDYRAMESDAEDIINKYLEAKQNWDLNAKQIIASQAIERNKEDLSCVFTDPKEKKALDNLEAQHKNARVAYDHATRMSEEIMHFATNTVKRLNDYDERMRKQEKNELLFHKSYVKTQVMNDYIRNLKKYLLSIDKVVKGCKRFDVDMTDIERQAEREKALIEAKLDRANESQAA
ncbi:hypothetical protein A3193_18515 [Candidatus Thiodiazotropha endoloripes]|uniref:hypothetical protein n=1 Tax=Candidatus Thiodiazotropha endoloripes TaxID=1818881 RepID=UPI00083CEBE0|nr:hypothetical protein [Candidatus Thiodiazotropha endoloripes]ODB82743.1 hypothetical protein A3193_18515 [Candidatus Thiodiazotropha endoloripes]